MRCKIQTRYDLQAFSCDTISPLDGANGALQWSTPESSQSRKAVYRFLWQNQESSCAVERFFCRRSSATFHSQNICARTRPQHGTAILLLEYRRFVQLVDHQKPYWREARIDASLVSFHEYSDIHKEIRAYVLMLSWYGSEHVVVPLQLQKHLTFLFFPWWFR